MAILISDLIFNAPYPLFMPSPTSVPILFGVLGIYIGNPGTSTTSRHLYPEYCGG